MKTKSGRDVHADFTVWAAGIRCPEILREIDGLETNRANQLVVLPTLQATRDVDIFAIGIAPVRDGDAMLTMSWGDKSYSVELKPAK